MGKETTMNLHELMKFRYIHEKDNNLCNDIPFYDMGNGKNIYVLTGHGYWNRKH